jgi:uncharacterized protein (DUF433 family)
LTFDAEGLRAADEKVRITVETESLVDRQPEGMHQSQRLLRTCTFKCTLRIYGGMLGANMDCVFHREEEYSMVIDRIEINSDVMLGKPVIRGTRIPVELILRKLSEGATEADLLDAYPRLTREDIRAALAYAADSLAHETILLQSTQ